MKIKYLILVTSLLILTGCTSSEKVLSCKEINSSGAEVKLILHFNENGDILEKFESGFSRTLVNDGSYDTDKAYENSKNSLQKKCDNSEKDYNISAKCDFNDKKKSFSIKYSGEAKDLDNLNNIFSIIFLDVETSDFENMTKMSYDEINEKFSKYENITCN